MSGRGGRRAEDRGGGGGRRRDERGRGRKGGGRREAEKEKAQGSSPTKDVHFKIIKNVEREKQEQQRQLDREFPGNATSILTPSVERLYYTKLHHFSSYQS